MTQHSNSTPAEHSAQDQSIRVPVHQEQLQVGKKAVDTGQGVRVHKTVVERPCEIDETLLRDEIQVEHVAVDQIVALSDAPIPRQEGDTFIVPVLEEVLVTEKRLRVKEELHITRRKRAEHHPETVVLKSEEISIERFDEGRETPE